MERKISHTLSHINQYEVVKKYKYLGHMLRDDFSDKKDVQFRLDNFHAKLDSVIRKFLNVKPQMLLFLFEAYCVPDYGLSLWDMKEIFKSQIFRTFESPYANALKKMHRLPRMVSNHIVANRAGVLLLRHHAACIQARFIK